MKKIILFLIGLMFLGTLSAQQTSSKIYVVHLTDKGVNTDASINPSLYLTDKAVERRIKHNISFDQSDIPVNEEYVKSISGSGARILTRSRWFNTLVIEATPEMLTSVSSFPFVSQVMLLENTRQLSSHKAVKPYFETETVNPWIKGFTKKATSDTYDYGAAYNQINQMHGQYLHNNGYSGQGMTIVVLDAGFNSADIMPCFDSLRANNQIKGTRDMAQPGNNVYGNWMHTHGTSVLSCMGANVSGQMIGTAPKADYWLVRTEVGETESIIEEYYWVAGAEFADSVGADLINSSLGYTTFDDTLTNHTYADMDGNTTVATIGADKAAEKGILVVNSAGNSGGGGWWYIGAPADGDSVFTIGAVDFAGNRAGFSSVGPTYDGRIKPTVDAQGVGSAIYYPGVGLANGSGTSFSSPITCGITACLWQSLPAYNNMQIIELMKATASQASDPDSLLGWGIPNVEKALTTLSVNTQSLKNTLYCYPNPIIDKITISFPDAIHGDYKIEIVNLQGQVVYNEPGNTASLRSIQINNLGNLAAGIYLVKVSNGALCYTNKIVKK